ncbi:turripeptide Ici9.1-like [Planococcus citri]|uniref:turripeptide Ici9.1-like n=1 Tax=Planococcus citri TaxID=170843 RepID=UPI0031F77A0A
MSFNVKVFVFVAMVFLIGVAVCTEPSNPIYNDPCVKGCSVTYDYSPFCGSDGQTYPTRSYLRCFQRCNKQITKAYDGQCKQ